MRLIDADELLTAFPLDDDEPRVTKWSLRMTIEHMPTIEPTITYEQVKEYCCKRCLVIVTAETFNDMKAIWNLFQKSDDNAESVSKALKALEATDETN